MLRSDGGGGSVSIGKSIFIWQIAAINGGNLVEIASMLKAGGFQSAILHSANLAGWRSVERVALIDELRKVGIQPIGGVAVYGANPTLEGQQAAAICRDYGLSAFVFDAESAFDAVPDASSAAVKLLWAFKAGVDESVQAGWCWWPLHHKPGGTGVYHPKSILWGAMQPNYGNADFGLPMMYWNWGDDPDSAVRYANESWAQWREITDKPLCPVGRAYIGDAGTAKPDAMRAFESRVREMGAEGVTWWSLQHALDAVHLPGVWPALVSMPGFGQGGPPPVPEPEPMPSVIRVLTDKLNIRPQPVIDASLGIQGQLFKGTEAKVLGMWTGNGQVWAQVQHEGWVCVDDGLGHVLGEVS